MNNMERFNSVQKYHTFPRESTVVKSLVYIHSFKNLRRPKICTVSMFLLEISRPFSLSNKVG